MEQPGGPTSHCSHPFFKQSTKGSELSGGHAFLPYSIISLTSVWLDFLLMAWVTL